MRERRSLTPGRFAFPPDAGPGSQEFLKSPAESRRNNFSALKNFSILFHKV
jgi:hypothetical protein